MYVWAKIPEHYREAWARSSSRRSCWREAKVAVSPGIGFGEYGDDHVRFALIENEHRTRQALRGIKRHVPEGRLAVERTMPRGGADEAACRSGLLGIGTVGSGTWNVLRRNAGGDHAPRRARPIRITMDRRQAI